MDNDEDKGIYFKVATFRYFAVTWFTVFVKLNKSKLI